ncbi:hypothetical protein FHS01_005535 [Longimicrobium terrae]|uniref:Uncharacterized protein n=1 Tax=Longimicrobium terrae TaxID=1639882 RepID=A0A841H7F7_9BACT|nr:hypothetical protein [Longimicrobium terrae]MBB6073832.1 hypothetical protein [Longimicrobium terrae]
MTTSLVRPESTTGEKDVKGFARRPPAATDGARNGASPRLRRPRPAASARFGGPGWTGGSQHRFTRRTRGWRRGAGGRPPASGSAPGQLRGRGLRKLHSRGGRGGSRRSRGRSRDGVNSARSRSGRVEGEHRVRDARPEGRERGSRAPRPSTGSGPWREPGARRRWQQLYRCLRRAQPGPERSAGTRPNRLSNPSRPVSPSSRTAQTKAALPGLPERAARHI